MLRTQEVKGSQSFSNYGCLKSPLSQKRNIALTHFESPLITLNLALLPWTVSDMERSGGEDPVVLLMHLGDAPQLWDLP